MKRGQLKRTSRLKRATAPLRRAKPLGRRNGRPKASRRETAILNVSTMREVYARQSGRCACGCGGRIAAGPIGYHHVFPKAKWSELADVAADVVGVTADCHANHETGARRLPREAVLCARTLTWTAQMLSYFERTYPA